MMDAIEYYTEENGCWNVNVGSTCLQNNVCTPVGQTPDSMTVQT